MSIEQFKFHLVFDSLDEFAEFVAIIRGTGEHFQDERIQSLIKKLNLSTHKLDNAVKKGV